MGSPRLTIVIPTVNRAALVPRAIESALAQTCPDIEIIVSDNGSTDRTPEVLERYRGVPRVRLNRIEKTIPANPHGNRLIEMSRGELFLGLSDDDWIEPDFSTKVIDFYDRHPEVAFVWTGCAMHYAEVAVPAKTGPEIERGTDFLAAFLAGKRNPCWCAVVTRTADLRRIGPIPTEVICGDMFFWTKLAANGHVGCIPEPLSHYVCYRDGGSGIAGGASILAWAKEMKAFADGIIAVQNRPSPLIERDGERFVARSTANQFIWKALRGAPRLDLLGVLGAARPFLRGGGIGPRLRVLLSLISPKKLLRRIVLTAAAHRRGSE